MSFKEFVCNEHLTTQLSRFITTKKILNSYVFTGENGVGKKTLSQIFIKALLCSAPTNSGACGVCSACRQFSSGNHPDVLYLKKQKDKKTIGIEEIREQVIKQAYIKPFISDKKVFVISEGDDLTQEAQNGLLKVLEEPPTYVTFIVLVTKKSKLLDTVLSRSCVLALRPVPKEEVLKFLQKKYPSFETEDLDFYAKFSQGIIGKALKIAEDDEYKSLFFETASHLASIMHNKGALVDFHRFLIENKDNADVLTDFMLIFLRDCIFSCEYLESMIICPKNLNDMSISQSDKKKFALCMDSVIAYKNKLSANVNFTILTLDLLTQIQKICNIS